MLPRHCWCDVPSGKYSKTSWMSSCGHSLLHLLLISTRSFQYQCTGNQCTGNQCTIIRRKHCPTAWLVLELFGAFETTAGSRHSALFCVVNSMKIKTRGNRYWHFLSFSFFFFGGFPLNFIGKTKISTNSAGFKKCGKKRLWRKEIPEPSP